MGRSFPFWDFHPIILYHILTFLIPIMWAKNKIIIGIFVFLAHTLKSSLLWRTCRSAPSLWSTVLLTQGLKYDRKNSKAVRWGMFGFSFVVVTKQIIIIIIWAVSVRNAPLDKSVVLLACVSRGIRFTSVTEKRFANGSWPGGLPAVSPWSCVGTHTAPVGRARKPLPSDELDTRYRVSINRFAVSSSQTNGSQDQSSPT